MIGPTQTIRQRYTGHITDRRRLETGLGRHFAEGNCKGAEYRINLLERNVPRDIGREGTIVELFKTVEHGFNLHRGVSR